MAYITNQWLKGNPERNRDHRPVKVEISTSLPTDAWSRRKRVVAEINLTREDGDYQQLSLRRADLNATLPTLVKGADRTKLLQDLARDLDPQLRRDVATAALLDLSDAELMAFLGDLLAARAAARRTDLETAREAQ